MKLAKKILGIGSVMCILLAIVCYYLYSTKIKEDSKLFGEKIIVAKTNIKEGEVLTDDNLKIKTVKEKDLPSIYITEDEIKNLENKVAAINIYKEEVIISDRLIDYNLFYPQDSKYVSLAITATDALSGEIKVGDMVSLWETSTTTEKPKKVLSNVKIMAIKDAQLQDTNKVEGAIVSSIIVKVNSDEEIQLIRDIKKIFITKDTNQAKTKLTALNINEE